MTVLIQWITHQDDSSLENENHQSSEINNAHKIHHKSNEINKNNEANDVKNGLSRERKITLVSTGWGGGEDFDIELEEHDMTIQHVSLLGSDDYASSGMFTHPVIYPISHIQYEPSIHHISHIITHPITHLLTHLPQAFG